MIAVGFAGGDEEEAAAAAGERAQRSRVLPLASGDGGASLASLAALISSGALATRRSTTQYQYNAGANLLSFLLLINPFCFLMLIYIYSLTSRPRRTGEEDDGARKGL